MMRRESKHFMTLGERKFTDQCKRLPIKGDVRWRFLEDILKLSRLLNV